MQSSRLRKLGTMPKRKNDYFLTIYKKEAKLFYLQVGAGQYCICQDPGDHGIVFFTQLQARQLPLHLFSKKIVEKHRGRIEVQSEVGVGTTFTVYLPVA